MDYTVHGILQARILEWVAFPSPRKLPNGGIELGSPALQADSLPSEPPGKEVVDLIFKPRQSGSGAHALSLYMVLPGLSLEAWVSIFPLGK